MNEAEIAAKVEMIAKLKAIILKDMGQFSCGNHVIRDASVIATFAFNKCDAKAVYSTQALYLTDVIAACESLVDDGALLKLDIDEKHRTGIYYQKVKRSDRVRFI